MKFRVEADSLDSDKISADLGLHCLLKRVGKLRIIEGITCFVCVDA